jgi:hypothetical protein
MHISKLGIDIISAADLIVHHAECDEIVLIVICVSLPDAGKVPAGPNETPS